MKAYKKSRRKATRPWKGLSIFTAVIMVFSMIASVLVGMFDNTLTINMGDEKFWKLENEDANAQYFSSDLGSAEEKRAYEEQLCEQVEAEGAVLLMNKDQTLPLQKGSKISCFSSSTVDIVYGGTGSGTIDTSKAVNLKSACTNAGFEFNETLWNFYLEGDGSEYKRDAGSMFGGTSATVGEVPWSVYTNDVKDSIAAYGDAAVIVFSRVGGEGADLTHKDYNYLALNEDETALLDEVSKMKAAGQVKKIIVLINSANTLQVDFLKNEAYGIDACLWIGDVGETGIYAVADILAGDVTPSGRLVDTYCYDNYSAPAMVNFGTTKYTNADDSGLGNNQAYYIIYQEGIYVGYRYYETRYEDYVMGTGNAGNYAYQENVAYPFGYGLSYTDFAYSGLNASYNSSKDVFEVSVTVTNTGDTYSGKETVQIYAQSPYTEYDKENNVEKASVTLCGFGKTQLLAPGASETLTIEVEKRELASYDAYGAKTYILDAGEYYLTAARNAHDAVNQILAAKGYTKKSTDGRMDTAGDENLVYTWTQKAFDQSLYDMMDLPYDDPQWDLLLDQLTFDDMERQIGDAFHWTMPIESVQAPGSRDENGPQGLTASLLKGANIETIGFTSEDIMAATFNRELIYEVGRCIGADCVDAGVAALYGPGNNIHRTPFSGRNFEYYSEDGYLSGEMSLAEVSAIEKYGVDVMMKHFVLNDCEENRLGLGTWSNEQAIREIYLKAFQAPAEKGGVNGVMTSYSRLGARWAGGNYNLITNVLMNEWGCTGRVITDNSAVEYMNFVDTVMAGGTLLDAMIVKNGSGYEKDPVVVSRMREAVHRNLYSILTSCAMNGVGADTSVKEIVPQPLATLNIARNISVVLFVVFLVMWIRKRTAFVKENGRKKDIV